MKETRQCPKCNSSNVHTNARATKRGDRAILPISNWTSMFIDTYICWDCGYLEEYINAKDLKDPANLEKINKEWKK